MLIIAGLVFLSFAPLFSSSTYLKPYDPYYSQGGQDKFLIESVFKFKKNGVFFDIGAHDGISYSNTYYLEEFLGWTGVCIEPQRANYDSLVTRRPNSICIHGCAFDRAGEIEFLHVDGPSEMLSGIIASYDPRHYERAKKEVKELGGRLEVITSQAFLVNDICKKYDIRHIDLLCIDTEGSEERILKSIDFSLIDISVICVENNYNEKNICKFLQSVGFYLLTTVSGDDIYINKKFDVN